MRCLLPAFLALTTAGLVSGSDEIPRRVLIDESEYVGRHEGLYVDAHYLWLHIDQLAKERAEWRLGLDDEQDVVLSALELFEEFAQDKDDDDFMAAVIQHGAARAHGLKNGRLIPPERFADVCKAKSFDPSVDGLLDKPPYSFPDHAREARGAVLGRVLRIEHGFTGPLPALLLVLDVEEALFASDYSQHPYLAVTTSGYVHDDTVYCSLAGMGGWLPRVGDRLIAMPITGPWDKDGEIMPIVDPVEVFLVGEPDSVGVSEVKPLKKRKTVPRTLFDFRHRLWEIRDAAESDHP